jgi:hypothetical protein
MPRLQVMASNEDDVQLLDGLYQDAGQGSDTFDLCCDCAEDLEDEGLEPYERPTWLTLSIDTSLGIMLTGGVETPVSYEDDHYQCCACSVILNHKDD